MKPPTRRKQRVSNTLRGFFTRKQVNVPRLTPKPPPARLNTPRNQFETVLNFTDRIFLFWYSRINPDKANAFLEAKGSTERYSPIDPSQKKLTPLQKKNLLTLVDFIFTGDEGDHAAEFADTLMDVDLGTFNEEMEEYELTGKPIFDHYKKKWVTAETFAKSMERLPTLLRKSQRNLEYYSNWSENLCGLRPDMLTNSFSTFQSDYCIPVLTPTADSKRKTMNSFSLMTNWTKGDLPMKYPSMVVRSQYMPKITNNRSDHVFIKAKLFPTTSWIIDAFQNDAVLDINFTLAELMKKEAFDLWNYSFWFTVYKISGLETIAYEKEKYLITDNSIFPTKTLYANLNFFIEPNQQDKKYSLLLNALKAKKIYGFDPVTSLYLRKYLTKEWVHLTKDPNITAFFKLPFVQQMLICKLQHNAYLKIAFGQICGSIPIQNNKIQNNSNETPLRKAALLKGLQVYQWNLSEPAIAQQLLSYIDEPEHIQTYVKVLERF